jgi:uncharacterized protein YutE (UPF0331/DUF86 family)
MRCAGSAGVTPKNCCTTTTARFRNLLVHGYAKVDDTRVVEILRDRVDDLAAFRIALARAASG